MKPWDRQNSLKENKIPTINDVINIAQGISNHRTRALFIIMYLTGARICEIVRYNRKGIKKDSIKMSDIEFINIKGREIMKIGIRNEKNRVRKFKDIPLPLDKPENKMFLELLKEHFDSVSLGDELFPFGYQNAYKILKPYWNPHWNRHLRATHLVTVYGMNEQLMVRYLGWTDSRPAKHYSELRWEDLVDSL